VNPCGINPAYIRNHPLQNPGKIRVFNVYHTVIPLTDKELMQNIILSARNALTHSDEFKERFVRKSFFLGQTYEQHVNQWKWQRMSWMPTIKELPKYLDEDLKESYLSTLKMDTALSTMYNYLQRVAVGLEQVVLDQAAYDGEFTQEFNEAEYKLKAVLCELQVAMLERGIQAIKDPSRDDMPEDVRNLKYISYRAIRDWFVFRDYMNILEYIIQTSTYIMGKNES